MLGTLLEPAWLGALILWNFAVLAAAQLTIRLIMAFSVRTTLIGTAALTVAAILVSIICDALLPTQALSARLTALPLAMVLMAIAGFATARWLLRIKRLRGQLITGLMVGLLDFHLFTLLSP
jgi:hypothetical protein